MLTELNRYIDIHNRFWRRNPLLWWSHKQFQVYRGHLSECWNVVNRDYPTRRYSGFPTSKDAMDSAGFMMSYCVSRVEEVLRRSS